MKKAAVIALLASLLLFTGCVDESQNGDTREFTFALWVPILVVVGCFLGAGIGWLIRHRNSSWGYGLMVVGFILALVIAPGMYFDKVTLGPDRFTLRTGFWFAPTEHDIEFSKINLIRITKEEKRGRRGRKKVSYTLVCNLKAGGVAKVPIGTLMDRVVEDVLEEATRQGVPTIDAM